MGRPIKDKYFGNLSYAPNKNRPQGSGVGGEGFGTVTVLTTGTLYSTTTNYTWTASAPQIAGGVAASGTLTIGTDKRVLSYNVGVSGSGYTSTGSVTVTVSPATTGSAATYAIGLTTNRSNAITIISYISTGSSAVSNGDIIKQESSQRYLVRNSQGIGACHLTTGTLVAGQMHIIATDWGGATYWVKKLTSRKALLYPRTSTSTAYVSYNRYARWTIGAATGTNSSTIVSINHTN